MNSFAVVAERIRCRVCCRVLPACLFVLFAGARIGNAAESELSLDAAIALALTRAPMIEAREAGIAAATEEVARAAALPDPMLALGVQNLPIAGADAYSLDAEGMTMRSIGITQALPSRAKREARRGSALAFQSEADATRSATVLETKQAVASAWIALWAAERERSLIEELREQARLAVAASKARLGGGAGTASDSKPLPASGSGSASAVASLGCAGIFRGCGAGDGECREAARLEHRRRICQARRRCFKRGLARGWHWPAGVHGESTGSRHQRAPIRPAGDPRRARGCTAQRRGVRAQGSCSVVGTGSQGHAFS